MEYTMKSPTSAHVKTDLTLVSQTKKQSVTKVCISSVLIILRRGENVQVGENPLERPLTATNFRSTYGLQSHQ